MRTLSAALLAEQKKLSTKPCTKVVVGSDSYYLGDPTETSRILAVNHLERVYGGQAIVRIEVASDSIETDYRGKELQISYGFVTGYEEPEQPPADVSDFMISDHVFVYDGKTYDTGMFYSAVVHHNLPVYMVKFPVATGLDLTLLEITKPLSLMRFTYLYQHGHLDNIKTYYTNLGYTVTEEHTFEDLYTRNVDDTLTLSMPEGVTLAYPTYSTDPPRIYVRGYACYPYGMTNSPLKYAGVNYNSAAFLAAPGDGGSLPIVKYINYGKFLTRNIDVTLFKYKSYGVWKYVTAYYQSGAKAYALSAYISLESYSETVTHTGIFTRGSDGIYTYVQKLGISVCSGYTTPPVISGDLVPGSNDDYSDGNEEYSGSPPLRVFNQVYVSEPGINYMELECIDYWQVLDNLPCIGTNPASLTLPFWKMTKKISEIFTILLANTGITTSVVSSDGDYDNSSFKPYYACQYVSTSIAEVLIDLISMTLNSLRFNESGNLEVVRLDVMPAGYDYVYSLTDADAHRFFTNKIATKDVMPNVIVFADSLSDTEAESRFTGSDTDDASVARWNNSGFIGRFPKVFVNPMIESDAEAASFATSMLTRIQLNVASDIIEVPMNVGQELLDFIQVQDERNGSEEDGIVGMIERIVAPGLNRMKIQMGGISVGLSTEATNQWWDKYGQEGEVAERTIANPVANPEEFMKDAGLKAFSLMAPNIFNAPMKKMLDIGLSNALSVKSNTNEFRAYTVVQNKKPRTTSMNNFLTTVDMTPNYIWLSTESQPRAMKQNETPEDALDRIIAELGEYPGITGTAWEKTGWHYDPVTRKLVKTNG